MNETDEECVEIAEEVLALIKDSFQAQHEFISVDDKNFEGVDPEFYTQQQARFEALGFEFICDLEDKTISDQGKIITFIRTMRDPASNAMATFYHVPMLDVGFFEFESFLSDGRCVVSTMVPESNKIANWPSINNHYYPIDIGEDVLYKNHLSNDKEACDGKVNAIEVTSFEALAELLNAKSRYMHKYLQSIGWVTKEYLLNQCSGDQQLTDRVYSVIQKMAKQPTSQEQRYRSQLHRFSPSTEKIH